jgi:IclR family KDG regulon transcriptional repressor
MPPRPPYAAPAVEAALSILETLGAVHQMGVTDLANKLNLSKSSVYRLLATLVRCGYVEKNPQNDRYQLTYRLFAVGSPAADRFGLREAAHPIMERLAEETGETVNLGVLDGTRVVNLHKVESRHLLRMHMEVGGGVPAHATALGKVLLAALEPSDLTQRLGSQRLTRLTAGRSATAPPCGECSPAFESRGSPSTTRNAASASAVWRRQSGTTGAWWLLP